MKNVDRSKSRTRVTPLRITLTEAEILADLQYPVDPARIERSARAVDPGISR